MNRILIAGGGKIGSLIACMLAHSGDYDVFLVDKTAEVFSGQSLLSGFKNLQFSQMDIADTVALRQFLQKHRIQVVVSALPFYCNRSLADAAHQGRLFYFDLSEDVENARHIRQLANQVSPAFVPQCGLAPGYISIVANHLMTHFETIDTVKMRVGALPLNPNNALKYSLTWSTDGLINEYINPCFGLEDGEMIQLAPLEGYETITLDGDRYEAFNTSGGMGTLAESFVGKVNSMNYKTLRYPGHCKIMQLLLQDLKLNQDRDTLKRILENALPQTLQDVVLIYVSVTGKRQGTFFEESDVSKVYPQRLADTHWSAIQLSTAAGLCSVLDLTLHRNLKGFVTQESFPLKDIVSNRFGGYFKGTSASGAGSNHTAGKRSA